MQKAPSNDSHLGKQPNGACEKSLFLLFFLSLVWLGDYVIEPLEFMAGEYTVKSLADKAHCQYLLNIIYMLNKRPWMYMLLLL